MTWLELASALFDLARATTGLAVNWLIQSALLVSGGLLLGFLLRDRGSAVQSAVYRTTLVAVLACPVATWALSLAGFSGWSLQMPEAYQHESITADAPANGPPVIEPLVVDPVATSAGFQPTFDSLASVVEPGSTFESDSSELTQSEDQILDAPPAPQIAEDADQAAPIETIALSEVPAFSVQGFGIVAVVAGALWLAAGGFLLCRLGLAWWKLNRLRRSAWGAEPRTLDVCRELAALLEVSPPEVLHSPYLPSPCLAGLRRPAVLLPEAEMSLPVRDVLVHELAHLRRHDCWWNLLRRTATALLFFQPLLWKLSRRLDSTAEEVCDDYVVQLGGDRRQYAHRLVDIAELSLAPAAAAGVGIVSLRSMLATRVARIMDTSRSLSTRAGTLLLAVVFLSGLGATLLVGLVGIKPDQAAAETPNNAAPEEDSADEPDNTENDVPVDSDVNDLITVRGQVVDPNGRAVPRADVYALRWYWDFGDPKPLAQVKVDDSGRFEISYRKSQFFDGGRPDQWREAHITAFADGFGPGWMTYGELKPGEEVTLRLVPDDVPIEGRIVDLEGRPVAGATIEIGYLNASKKEDLSDWLAAVRAGQSISTAFKHLGEALPASSARRWQGFTTDEDGRFRMTGIGRERQVKIYVKHPSIVTKTLSVVTRQMEPLSQPAYDSPRTPTEVNYGAQFEFAAAPSRPIEGVVRDAESGEPIAGAQIWSSQFAGENVVGVSTIKTKSDDRGRYRLEGMPKGEGNEIDVVPTDLPYFTANFEVPDSLGTDPAKLDIELHRGQWITGRVTDKETGRGVSARMYYIATPDNPIAPTLPEIADATHIIRVQDRYRTNPDGSFRVVGLPGRGVVAVGVIQGAYPGGQGYEVISDRENRDGYRKFNSALSPGEKYPTAMKEVHVPEGDDGAVCDFVLDSGRRVTLQVVDPAGMPLGGFEVQGIREVHDTLQPMSDASFDVVAMRDNEARTVLLHHKERGLGKALRVKPADGEAGPITVRLERLAKVSGRLVDGDGEPVAGVYLRIDVSGEGGYGKGLPATATDAEGQFQHDGFLPGLSYNLLAEGAKIEFATVARELKVQAGEAIDLGTIDVTKDERPEPKRMAADASRMNSANDGGSNTIRGQVVDKNGKPISGATVRLPDDIGTGGESVSTNDEGRFEIAFDKAKYNKPEWHQEPWRLARLLTTADGFGPAWVEGAELARVANHTIQLNRDDVPIRGQILTLEGQPVPHAKLEIWDIYDPHSGNLDELFKTLRDSPSMFQPHMNRQMSYFPGSLLDLKVERGTLSRGTLSNAGDGNPVITTDEDGRFEFRGIGPERMVRLWLQGRDIQSTQINVATRSEIDRKWQRDDSNEQSRMMMDSGAAPPHVHAATFKHFAGPSAPIRGIVRDKETGKPIAGIHVGGWLRNTNNHAHAVTDENGRYELTGLSVEGTFQQLYVGPKEEDRERLPYIGAEKERMPFSVTSPLSEADTTFELTRGIVVRGRVIDAANQQPVKARIEYIGYDSNPHVQALADELWPYAHAMTDDEGQFAIAVLPGPGTLAVWTRLSSSVPDKYRPVDPKEFGVPVDDRGFVSTANGGLVSTMDYKAARFIDFRLGEAPPFIELKVNPLSDVVHVRCVDQDGKSLQSVSVVGHLPWSGDHALISSGGLERERGDRIYIEIAELGTESRNPVVFLDRERQLIAVLFGSQSKHRPRLEDLKQADDGAYLLELVPSATITGQLVDAEGEPLRSGEAELRFVANSGAQPGGIEFADKPTDQNGRFEFRGLPAGGPYLLGGGNPAVGGGILKRDIALVAGQTLDLGTLDVTQAEPTEPKKAARSETADEPARAANNNRIRGRVLDSDGKPVSGAKFYWFRSRVHDIDPIKPRLIATSDESGSFQFDPPSMGSKDDVAGWDYSEHIVVRATGHGFAYTSPASLRQEMTRSNNVLQALARVVGGAKGATIQLPAAGEPIRGRLVNVDGQAVAGATVSIRWFAGQELRRFWQHDVEDGGGEHAELRARVNHLIAVIEPVQLQDILPITTTDADGRFELRDIGPDTLVQLLIRGEGIESTELVARNDSVEKVVLEPDRHSDAAQQTVYGREFLHAVGPSKPVEGRVVDLDSGEPIVNAVVRAFRIHGSRLHSSRERQQFATRTDSEGLYRIAGLPIGTDNELVAFATGDVPYVPVGLQADASVAGDVVKQDFRLKRGVWAEGRVFDADTSKPLTGELTYYYFRNDDLERQIPGVRKAYVDGLYWTNSNGEFRVPVLPTRGVLAFRYDGLPFSSESEGIERYPRGYGADDIAGSEDIGSQKSFPTQPHFLNPSNYQRVAEVNPKAGDKIVRVDMPLVASKPLTVRIEDRNATFGTEYQVYGITRWGWSRISEREFKIDGLEAGEVRKVLVHHRERNLAGGTTIRLGDDDPFKVELQPAGSIRGRLVDDAGEPITDATVIPDYDKLWSAPGAAIWAAPPDLVSNPTQIPVDSEGRFKLDGLVPGWKYSAWASAHRQMGAEVMDRGIGRVFDDVTIEAGQSLDLGDVKPKSEDAARRKEADGSAKAAAAATETEAASARRQIIRGRITMPDGKPAAGAHVAVVAASLRQQRGGDLGRRDEVLAEASTNADGLYEISLEGVSSKSHRNAALIARADGSALAWRRLNLDDFTAVGSLELAAEEPIRGRLVDIEGRPAGGVRMSYRAVMLTMADGRAQDGVGFREFNNPPAAWPPAVTSDDDGRFVVPAIAAGQGAMLAVEATDRFAPQALSLNTGLPEQRGESDGTYRSQVVRNLKPGEEPVLALAPAQIFEGVVTYVDTGKAAPHARLTIWASQQKIGSMVSVPGKADAQGRYRISPYPGIRFGVTAYPPDGEPYLTRELPPVDWEDVATVKKADVTLPRGVLVRGKVVEAGTDRPVSSATIQYVPEDANNPNDADDILTGWQGIQLSNARGGFEIVVLPGPGTLLVHGPKGEFILRESSSSQLSRGEAGGQRKYAHAFEPIEPQADSDAIDLNIELDPAKKVSGHIVDESGAPVDESLMITRLYITPHSPYWRGFPVELFGGRFELGGLESGQQYPTHFLDPKRRLGTTVNLKADDTPKTIVLEPCGEATARFVDPEGQPLDGFRPMLEMIVAPGAHQYDFDAMKQGKLAADTDYVANIDRTNYLSGPQTDDEGRVTFPALIPGATYRLGTIEDGKGVIVKDFSIGSGESLDLGDIVMWLEN